MKFDVLQKMANMKAGGAVNGVKNANLIHFVSQQLESEDKEVLTFADGFVSVWAAAEISFKQLDVEMRQLEGDLNKTVMEMDKGIPLIENAKDAAPGVVPPLKARLESFLAIAQPRMADMKTKLAGATNILKGIMKKFGEGNGDPAEDTQKQFLGQLTGFAKTLKSACEDNAKVRAEEEKKKKKEEDATATPKKRPSVAQGTAGPAGTAAKPDSKNIFGSFNTAQNGSQNDIMAEMRMRMKKRVE